MLGDLKLALGIEESATHTQGKSANVKVCLTPATFLYGFWPLLIERMLLQTSEFYGGSRLAPAPQSFPISTSFPTLYQPAQYFIRPNVVPELGWVNVQ